MNQQKEAAEREREKERAIWHAELKDALKAPGFQGLVIRWIRAAEAATYSKAAMDMSYSCGRREFAQKQIRELRDAAPDVMQQLELRAREQG